MSNTATDVGTTDRTDTTTDTDQPRMAHIVYPASAVTEALINGTSVTALCGHTWIPGRDPLQYPLCEACKQIAADMRATGARGWEIPSC